MKYLIFLLFPLLAHAQMDTIYLKSGKFMIGTIGNVTSSTIFFRNHMDIKDNIKLSKVSKYVITKKIPKVKISIVDDSLLSKSLVPTEYNIKEELDYMKECFRKCHNNYSIGVGISIVGLLVAASGISIDAKKATINDSNSNIGIYMIYSGLGLSLIGSLTVMNSHKWIGRAGINANGIGVNIKRK